MFAGKKSAQIREILISESAWEEMTCLFAPSLKEDGTPFLEVHHIEWLSKGGEDSVENAIALCPNCHRQAHYGDLTLLPVNK
ncbi:hypothetical protein VEE69_15940 [Escherichia coli]|nr:hypothetical protein VEE69_15940 [Escherichia coli]